MSVCIGSVAIIRATERDGCCQISFYPFLLHFLFGSVFVSLSLVLLRCAHVFGDQNWLVARFYDLGCVITYY